MYGQADAIEFCPTNSDIPYLPDGQSFGHASFSLVDPETFPYFPDGHLFSQNISTAGDIKSGIRSHRPRDRSHS